MNQKKISLTQDRIAVVEKELGVKLTPVAKLCDFCDQSLPMHHKSFQCKLCPTIFDICDYCSNARLGDSCFERADEINEICHLPHEIDLSTVQKNDALTIAEKKLIQGLHEPKVFIYCENLKESHFCGYCKENFEKIQEFDEKKCQNYKSNYISVKKLLSNQTKKPECERLRNLLRRKSNHLVHCVHTCNALSILI